MRVQYDELAIDIYRGQKCNYRVGVRLNKYAVPLPLLSGLGARLRDDTEAD